MGGRGLFSLGHGKGKGEKHMICGGGGSGGEEIDGENKERN